MKILLITHFFPPQHNAGTENYTLGIAKGLQLRGHQVQVLCAGNWAEGNEYWNGVVSDVYHGVLTRRINLNWTKSADPNRVLYYSEPVKNWLSDLLVAEKFDIVHITSAYSLGAGILSSIKERRIPIVLTLMDFWFLCPTLQLIRSDGTLCDSITSPSECQSCLMDGSGLRRKLGRLGVSSGLQTKIWAGLAGYPQLTKHRGLRGKLLNMIERKEALRDALELPDLVLSHSQVIRRMFSRHTQRDIKVLRNGHELSWLGQYDGKTPSDTLRIGYIGQIIPVKGVHLLVEAFKKAKFDDAVILNIWGAPEKDPGYAAELRKSIGAFTGIHLRGPFEHDYLGKVFSEIDILVVPSIWYENAPLVIHEAFATKTPVIASDLGGMAEAISDNINGLLFSPGNVDDLAAKLKQLASDAALRERLALGISEVKQVEQESFELEGVYLQLIRN